MQALWVELKSGYTFYANDSELVDNCSAIKGFLIADTEPRRVRLPGDSTKVYTMGLRLYDHYRQTFIHCKPMPIAVFYIFQLLPLSDDD